MTNTLQDRRRRARDKLRALTFEPLMRGSLVERLRKCGKPYCACATDPERRHPQTYLSVKVDGRQHTLNLRPEDVEPVRQRLAAYLRLWELVEELTVCEVMGLRAAARQRRQERSR
jgi:hypothetical protein